MIWNDLCMSINGGVVMLNKYMFYLFNRHIVDDLHKLIGEELGTEGVLLPLN